MRTDRDTYRPAASRPAPRAPKRRRPRLAILAAVATAVAVLAACRPEPPTLLSSAHAASAPAARVLFDDEFNGSALSARWYRNRWFATTCAPGATANETQYFTASHVGVAGGMLRVSAQGPSYRCNEGSWSGTRPYSAGWVSTGGASTDTGLSQKPGFTFRYGHVDVRFREPAGRGLWPAIWLAADGAPRAPQSYPWPPEIDILESLGDPGVWSFHVHLPGSINAGKDVRGPNTSTGFHTVSLDWRATKISWFVDGLPVYTYTGPNIPSVPMYLIVNLATGGASGATDPSKLPATMLVDWVRVTS